MVSIFSYFPEFQADKVEPETAPRVAMGAVSPLWLMFGGAAAAGATYWWWASRWREAVNLEALMALAPEPVAPPAEVLAELEAEPEPVIEAVAAPVIESVAAVAEAAEVTLEVVQDAVEAAAEPVVEAVVTANEGAAEAVVEPVVEAEPAVVEAIEVVAEAPVEIVEEATPVVEAVVEAASEPVGTIAEVAAPVEVLAAAGDDLTRIVGVGPKLAASLAELGVTQFSQIAAWTTDELASFDQLLNLKGRAERDAWIAQAKRFATSVEA